MLPELQGAEPWLAASGLVVAGVIKGVTGIGYATVAMPLLAMVVGIERALALVVVPALVSNAAVFLGGGDLVGTFARFRKFYLGILPGIACGTVLLGFIDPEAAAQGLAAMTLAYVALAIAKPRLALPPGLERPLALPAGVLNGVLTGITGSQILPLVPYMLALRLDANTQVTAINLAVSIASVALGVALAASGAMTLTVLALSCAGAVPAILGTIAGNFLRGLVPVEGVRRLTLGMLVLVAVGLGGRALIEPVVAVACGALPADETATAWRAARCLAALGAPALDAALDLVATNLP